MTVCVFIVCICVFISVCGSALAGCHMSSLVTLDGSDVREKVGNRNKWWQMLFDGVAPPV